MKQWLRESFDLLLERVREAHFWAKPLVPLIYLFVIPFSLLVLLLITFFELIERIADVFGYCVLVVGKAVVERFHSLLDETFRKDT